MKINHNFFLNLAFNLAENNLGKTKSNPSVGCIIVKDNSVISSGVTSINGRPHAEYNALNKKCNFKDSNMYITLEPCTHYGKTPPCTKIIKKKKIKKVFYCYDDPDIRTQKKACKELKKNKIDCKKIIIKNNSFYKSYITNKIKKFPLIDAKIAISKDNFTINKKSKWITNLHSRKVGHLIRSKYDSIISTSKTINKDNSLLNCRIKGFDETKPNVIIIDRNLKLKRNLDIFKNLKKRKILIIHTSNNFDKINFFKRKKLKLLKLNNLKKKKDFYTLFESLFRLGNNRILVESGLMFLNELHKYKLINDLYVFRSSKKLKINGTNNVKTYFIKNYDLANQLKVNLKDDKLFKIRMK